MYSTSHLFFFGDLNFRVSLPKAHPLVQQLKASPTEALNSESKREELKEFDQLLVERRKGNAFVGLKDGDFWKFQCSYKYQLGEVDKYSIKRTPSWTDRVLYATYTDSADKPEETNIDNLLYTSIPSYTTSDHKPIVSLLLLPSPVLSSSNTPPLLHLPDTYQPKPDRYATLKRYFGRSLDRVVGYLWWLLTFFGAGSAVVGAFNFILSLGAWGWWKSSSG